MLLGVIAVLILATSPSSAQGPALLPISDAAGFKNAFATVEEPRSLIIQSHLDLSDFRVFGPLGPQHTFWMGNCTAPAPPTVAARLSRPLRAKECILLVPPEFVWLDFQPTIFFDLHFVVQRGPEMPALSEAVPAVMGSTGVLLMSNVHFVGDGIGQALRYSGTGLYGYGCSFFGFTAPHGAAIEAPNSRVLFIDTSFTNNAATSAGPALWLSSDLTLPFASLAWFHNPTFANNSAPVATGDAPMAIADRDARVYSDSVATGVFDVAHNETTGPWLLSAAPPPPPPGSDDIPPLLLQPSMFLEWNITDVQPLSPTGTRLWPEVSVEPVDGLVAASPFPAGPASAAVQTSDELQAALAANTVHIVLTGHIDLTVLAEQNRALWMPDATLSLRGRCEGVRLLPSFPAPPRPGQCVLLVGGTALVVTGSHTTRLWLDGVHIAWRAGVRRLPANDGIAPPPWWLTDYEDYFEYAAAGAPAAAGGPSATGPASLPMPGPEAAPAPGYGYDYDGNAYYGDYSGDPYGGEEPIATALFVQHAELWLTNAALTGTGLPEAGTEAPRQQGLYAYRSSIYARDSEWSTFDYEAVQNPDLLQTGALSLIESNATLVRVAFANCSLTMPDGFKFSGGGGALTTASIQADQSSPTATWLLGATFTNVTQRLPPPAAAAPAAAPAMGGAAGRRLKQLPAAPAAASGPAPAATPAEELGFAPVARGGGLQRVFAAGGEGTVTQLYDETAQDVVPVATPTDAEVELWQPLFEDNPWFSAVVQNASDATGGEAFETYVPKIEGAGDGGDGDDDGASTAAIVGGVVGGVAALAICVGIALCLVYRRRGPEDEKPPTPKWIAERQAANEFTSGLGATSKRLFRYQGTPLPSGKGKLHSDSGSRFSNSASNGGARIIHPHTRDIIEPDPAAWYIRGRTQREGSGSVAPGGSSSTASAANWTMSGIALPTTLPENPIDALEDTLDYMYDAGEPFLGVFRVHSSAQRRRGGQGIVQVRPPPLCSLSPYNRSLFVVLQTRRGRLSQLGAQPRCGLPQKGGPVQTGTPSGTPSRHRPAAQFVTREADGVDFVVKYFSDMAAFERELTLYQRPELHVMMPAVELIEENAGGRLVGPNSFPFPPFIVVERGESLNEWAQRVAPDGITAMFVLCHVAKRLEMLHTAGLSHRDLKPANILWRPRANAWTLIDFGCAAENGAETDLVFSLMYAAPELVSAMEQGDDTIVATGAVDVWALGVIAFELLTGTRTFPVGVSKREVCDRILGRKSLPWEKGSVGSEDLVRQMGHLRRTVLSCLERDAAERPSAREVLGAWNGMLERTTGAATGLLS